MNNPERTERIRLMVSIPRSIKTFLQQLADENCTSVNAEIVRSARERRERLEADKPA